jgi:hypothetical protein
MLKSYSIYSTIALLSLPNAHAFDGDHRRLEQQIPQICQTDNRGIDCAQAPSHPDLTMNVNIGANDRRTSMSNYPDVFPSRMRANLEKISGQVECLVETRTLVAEARPMEDSQQILTSAHVFAKKGVAISDQLPNCHFFSKANPSRKVPLDVRRGYYHLGSINPVKDRRNDYALVRLRGSVGKVQIPKVGSAPAVGETVYLVTNEAEGGTHLTDPRQLVAQDCTAMTSRQGSEIVLGMFVTDCSALNGDSGATYYAVRNGETLAVGFHEMSGLAANNRRPFDIFNPDPDQRSFALGLTFDERLLNQSRALAKRATGNGH